jgi:hypothetical protein
VKLKDLLYIKNNDTRWNIVARNGSVKSKPSIPYQKLTKNVGQILEIKYNGRNDIIVDNS